MAACLVLLALVMGPPALAHSQQDSSKVLLIGGWPSEASRKVEVIDLADGDIICPDIQDFPGAELGMVGTFMDGRVIACGGIYNSVDVTVSCHSLTSVDAGWTLDSSLELIQGRFYAASVRISEDEWWVSGGKSQISNLNSTEILTIGGGSSLYVELPGARFNHHVIKVNETHFVLLGGDYYTTEVVMLDTDAGEWMLLPDLPEVNSGFAAGLVTYPDGRQQVVVAGGYLVNFGWSLDLGTLEWSPFPALPEHIHDSQCVPYGDTLAVVGGFRSVDTFSDKIFVFDPVTAVWIELVTKLRIGREFFAAVPVPNDFLQCS